MMCMHIRLEGAGCLAIKTTLYPKLPTTQKMSIEHHNVIRYSAEITMGHSVRAIYEENTLQCACRKLRSPIYPSLITRYYLKSLVPLWTLTGRLLGRAYLVHPVSR